MVDAAKRDKVLEQVKGLLAKTVEKGATVEEAAAAAAKASELMLKYNIERSALEEKWREETLVIGKKYVKLPWTDRWMKDLMYAVARNNFCRVVYHGSSHYVTVVGAEHNVQVCEHLFDYLQRQAKRLTEQAWRQVKDYPEQYTTRGGYRNAFRYGFIDMVNLRLQKMRFGVEEKDETSKALIVGMDAAVEAALKQAFPELRSAKQTDVKDGYAYRDGARAGQAVALQSAVGGGTADPAKAGKAKAGLLTS